MPIENVAIDISDELKAGVIGEVISLPDGDYCEKFHNRTIYRNKFGELHRLNGPAIEYFRTSDYSGIYITRSEYWIKANRHREDGPAIILDDGSKMWYYNGLLHRKDGPAYIEYNHRGELIEKFWYKGVEYDVKNAEEMIIKFIIE